MNEQFDERQLIEEFKARDWQGVSIYKRPCMTLRKMLNKYPEQSLHFRVNGQMIDFHPDDHTLLKEALTEYELAIAFNTLWFVEHNWGLESNFSGLLWELMDELSRRCSENFKYEPIWDMSRLIMHMIGVYKYGVPMTLIYGNSIPCWCDPCRSKLGVMGKIETIATIAWGRLCLR